MSERSIERYRKELRGLTNEELIDRCGVEILGAAVLGSRAPSRAGWVDDCCDACYDEAKRRGNPDLYQRGFNEAVRSQGHRGMVRPVTTPVAVGEPKR